MTAPVQEPRLEHYVVLGNPVAHSQSPFIHAEFARQTGEPVTYGRELCPLDGFAAALRAFAGAGGRGCNVTVPFKFDACKLALRRSERAELAQAANVLRREGEGWSAENTDGIGLLRDIEHNAATPLAGQRVLLIGAGGAAAGVLGPIVRAGPAEVVVTNRSLANAQSLVQRHAAWAERHRVRLSAHALPDAGGAFDVVINASSSSLQRSAIPVAESVLRPGSLAVDLMYGPPAAPFLAWAEQHGALGRDGLGMLVEQAACAFEFWRGVMPATAPVLLALRSRLQAPA